MSVVAQQRTPSTARTPAARRGPLPLWYDALLAAVVTGATAYGLLVDDAYRVSEGVRADFPDVMRGQDVVTLLAVPAYLWLSHRARTGRLRDHLVRLGVLLYVGYSYVIYAVSPYNDAFLLYVAAIGLSVFGLLDGVFRLDDRVVRQGVDPAHSRGTGAFLVGVGALFVALWLTMLLPAVPGELPGGRVTYDIASPVHTLDLSMVLPLVVAAGVMLWRRLPMGVVLGAVVLTKIVTLGLALLAMNLLFTAEPSLAETALWAVIAAAAAVLLVGLLGHVHPVRRPFLRGSLWH